MSQSQIRLARTPDINKVLSYLQNKYQLLSEADIIKLALSEEYNKVKEATLNKEDRIRQAWIELRKEGKKLGERLMRKKGLDPKKVSEREFYDLILDTHKHA